MTDPKHEKEEYWSGKLFEWMRTASVDDKRRMWKLLNFVLVEKTMNWDYDAWSHLDIRGQEIFNKFRDIMCAEKILESENASDEERKWAERSLWDKANV